MHWYAGVLVVAVAVSRCDAPASDVAESPAPPQQARSVAATQPSSAKADSLLSDSALWGRDFAAALRALPAYESAGETSVLVFDHRVIGNRRFAAPDTAAAAAKTAAVKLSATQRAPLRNSRVLASLTVPQHELRAPVPVTLPEDGALHLGNDEPALQLLAEGLEISTVTSRHGAPESTRTVTIDDGTERRPRILKLHSYDNGAIVFATSTGAVNPAVVERVILDAKRVSAAVQ